MAERGFRPVWAVLCGAGVLGLAACGGGVDAVDAPPGPEALPAVVISQANANRVAAEALQAVSASLASARASEGSGVAGAAASSARQAVVARALGRSGGAVTPQANESQRLNCAGGGTVTATLTTAGALLQPGDKVVFLFSFCKEGEIITNGNLTLTLVDLDTAAAGGTLEVYDAVVANLDQTSGGVLERMNGTVRVSFDDRRLGERRADQLDIEAKTVTTAVERRINGGSRASRSLQNLVLTRSDVGITQRSVSFVSFTQSGSMPVLNDVSFKVDTITAIVIPAGGFQPTSGEIKITGKDNTSIIIRIGADAVALEIDTDGNGTADTTVQRSWAQVVADL